MDVFSWSMPFLAEKITNMLLNVVKNGGEEEEEGEDYSKVIGNANRKGIIAGKIKAVATMSRMFSTLREESELLLKIKNMSPDGRIPRGLLM